MKRYTVSQARERLADVLDEVERGGSVVIERRNVHYVIRAKRVPQRARAGQSVIETLDPAVESGQWHWDWSAAGAKFSGRRRRT